MQEVIRGIRLSERDRARLQELVRRAEREQDAELLRALDVTLRVVPGPLRSIVRKVLGA